METSVTCCARAALLPNVSSQQYSTTALAAPRSISPSFSIRVHIIYIWLYFLSKYIVLKFNNNGSMILLQSLKSSSLFGESLHVAPKSSLNVSKTKSYSLMTKCEIGDSLVSLFISLIFLRKWNLIKISNDLVYIYIYICGRKNFLQNQHQIRGWSV